MEPIDPKSIWPSVIGRPDMPAIGGLEDAAAGSAKVVDQRLTRHAHHRVHAPAAEGADLPQL